MASAASAASSSPSQRTACTGTFEACKRKVVGDTPRDAARLALGLRMELKTGVLRGRCTTGPGGDRHGGYLELDELVIDSERERLA